MKKSTLFHLTYLLAVVFLFPRCGITLYVPNTINSPLLGEKGDYKINAGLVTQAPEPTFDFQGAYAVSDHFGLMANTSFMSGNEGSNEGPNTHILLEAAGGLFTPFGPAGSDWKMGRAEIYGGYGFGWAEDYDENNNQVKGKYQRAFIQPAIGFRQKVADFSFSPRMAFVNFGTYESTPLPTTKPTLRFSTFEPTATVSLGYKRGRVYLQLSRVLLMSGREDYEQVTLFDDGEEYRFNIGGSFCTWKKKEVEPPPVSLDRTNPPQDFEREGKASQAPASITVNTTDFTICVKEGGDPDGDIVSLIFNGVYLAKELELAKELHCYDVAVAPGQEGTLRIETISAGVFTPNTIQVLVRQGKLEKLYYLRAEEGQVEEIKFKQQ